MAQLLRATTSIAVVTLLLVFLTVTLEATPGSPAADESGSKSTAGSTSCGSGCGNGCNCPNEKSCTSGKAKTMCSWLSGQCTCNAESTNAPTPVPSTLPPGPVCSNNASFDPYTACQCPTGTVPADNGCCKTQVAAHCLADHPNLLRSTYDPAQMDGSGLRMCNYMWGDPHAKYQDFRFDPQWHGWMLMTQCDGLKVFSFTRKPNKRRVTVQSQILVQYRSSVIHVVHDYATKTAALKVKSLDAQATGSAARMTPMPLPDIKKSATVGEGGAQLTLSRLSATKIQICTAAGDTLKIIRVRNRALQFQSCLAPTCNLRATGFMGIHGAEREARFPLPNSMDSQGELPKNKSPYQKEYMKQWYAETNRQLRGVFPLHAPQFPTTDSDVCHGYKLAATPAPTVPRTERYRYFYADSNFKSLKDADNYCAQQGGYLANFVTYADAVQFKNDMSSARVGSSYYRSITGGTDSGVEGTWVWKYGPPATRGTVISKGRGRSSKCKQSKCFWRRNEPNNWRGREDILEIWRGWNQWNDISSVNHRKVICEFVIETNSTTDAHRSLDLQSAAASPIDKLNSNSAAQRLISNALAAGGVDEEMAQSAAEQRNVTEGTSCTDIIAQCRSMNCPNAIFTENEGVEEQCEFAQEWIIAREVNQDLPPDSPFRLDENATSPKAMDQLENTNECDVTPGSHYCDACGESNGAGCFTCGNVTCLTDQILTPDPATATCHCQNPEPPAPECAIDDDCQWSLLSIGLTGPEYLHCALHIGGKCLVEGGPVYVINGTAFILLNVSIAPEVTFNATHIQAAVFQKISAEAFAKNDLELQGATLDNVLVGNIRRYKGVGVVRCTISFTFEQPKLRALVPRFLDQDFQGAVPMGYSVLSRSYDNNNGGDFPLSSPDPSAATNPAESTSPGVGNGAAATDGAGDASTVPVVLGVVLALALMSVVVISVVLVSKRKAKTRSSGDDLIPGQNRAFDASSYQQHFLAGGDTDGGELWLDEKEQPMLQEELKEDDVVGHSHIQLGPEVRARRSTVVSNAADEDTPPPPEEDQLLKAISQARSSLKSSAAQPPQAPKKEEAEDLHLEEDEVDESRSGGRGGDQRGKSVIRGASVIHSDFI